jgi:hypothetical protein
MNQVTHKGQDRGLSVGGEPELGENLDIQLWKDDFATWRAA